MAAAYGLELEDFCTCLYRADTTTLEAARSGDPYRACQESDANRFIQAPPSLDHRYMHEDICSGLLPISQLGRLAGVPTPSIDPWYAGRGHDGPGLPPGGRDLEKMRLSGMTVEQVRRFVLDGVLPAGDTAERKE